MVTQRSATDSWPPSTRAGWPGMESSGGAVKWMSGRSRFATRMTSCALASSANNIASASSRVTRHAQVVDQVGRRKAQLAVRRVAVPAVPIVGILLPGGVPIGHAVRGVGAAQRACLHVPLHLLAAALGVQVSDAHHLLVRVLLVRSRCAGWVARRDKRFEPLGRDALHELIYHLPHELITLVPVIARVPGLERGEGHRVEHAGLCRVPRLSFGPFERPVELLVHTLFGLILPPSSSYCSRTASILTAAQKPPNAAPTAAVYRINTRI